MESKDIDVPSGLLWSHKIPRYALSHVLCFIWYCLILTHWGRATHICIDKLTIIGSDNGLLQGECQTIIRTNTGILLIGPLGTNFREILIAIETFSLKKIYWKILSGMCRPFCLRLNVLITSFIKGYFISTGAVIYKAALRNMGKCITLIH